MWWARPSADIESAEGFVLSETEIAFWVWPAFIGLVFFYLALDLLVFHREAQEISIKDAFVWSIVWTALGLGFAGVVWLWLGSERAGEYLAGYVIERSLSIDNIFVFALIFGYFKIPAAYQHRVLVWGIVGAVVFRIAFILAGATLLETFGWMIYLFGGFLVFTGLRMAFGKEIAVRPETNLALRMLRRVIPVTSSYDGTRFFTRQNGLMMATPLLRRACLDRDHRHHLRGRLDPSDLRGDG